MIIYKYLDEKGAIKTIKRNSVLLRTPLEFNDPFDSIFYISPEEMARAFKLYMNYSLFKKLYDEIVVNKKKPTFLGKITAANIKNDLPVIKKAGRYKKKMYIQANLNYAYKVLKINLKDVKKQFSEMMKTTMDSLKGIAIVSCFGSINDSILMWSHYANKHKGACIEFEIDDKDFRKVNYSPKLLNFSFTDALEIYFSHEIANKEIDTNDPDKQFLLEPIFTKSIDWEYEGEIRCVFSKMVEDERIYKIIDDDGEEKTLLKMPKIKRIYLGCNAKEDFIKTISDIAGDIPVVKMKKCEDKYGVEEIN